MIKRSAKKIREKIKAARNNFEIKQKFIIKAAGTVIICGTIWWLTLPLPQNYESKAPTRPELYSAEIAAFNHNDREGTILKIEFRRDHLPLIKLPEYQIEEIFSEGKTRIVFSKIARLEGFFDYEKVAASPLIEDIKHTIDGQQLVIEISHRKFYSKINIVGNGNSIAIILPIEKDGYPVISNQKPADNSMVFPMRHTISFEAILAAPLEKTLIFVNDNPTDFRADQIAPNEYRFAFEQEVEIDKEYQIRAIVADQNQQTAIARWTFEGQIPIAAALGKDRFKYQGWWGQINANGVAVRQEASAASDKLGSLSTANRVKIIKEVFGDWVGEKNLWYQIDGGMHAGAYVFSEFVTPMNQPAPPADFTIPAEVREGEKWIDVDLSKKILTLFDYDKPLFATYVAVGREENPTKTGTYRVWYKLTKDDMRGGPPLHSYYYHLKDIPWVMYYNYDYAIHGTYWHDKFGTRQSAGCTNMTQGDAEFIFKNTLPEIPEGKEEIFAREKPNIGYGTGTVVHNHE